MLNTSFDFYNSFDHLLYLKYVKSRVLVKLKVIITSARVFPYAGLFGSVEDVY